MDFFENIFRSLEREMNTRFERVDMRFDAIDARLDRMDVRLSRLDRTVSAGTRQVANLTEWAEKQDQFQADTVRRIAELDERIQKLDRPNGHQ
jgi:chromosome segregation ATPase